MSKCLFVLLFCVIEFTSFTIARRRDEDRSSVLRLSERGISTNKIAKYLEDCPFTSIVQCINWKNNLLPKVRLRTSNRKEDEGKKKPDMNDDDNEKMLFRPPYIKV